MGCTGSKICCFGTWDKILF